MIKLCYFNNMEYNYTAVVINEANMHQFHKYNNVEKQLVAGGNIFCAAIYIKFTNIRMLHIVQGRYVYKDMNRCY